MKTPTPFFPMELEKKSFEDIKLNRTNEYRLDIILR